MKISLRLITMLMVLLLAACGGDEGDDYYQNVEYSGGSLPAGFVLKVGVNEDKPEKVELAAEYIKEKLLEYMVPAETEVYATYCSPVHVGSDETKGCYEIRVFVPHVKIASLKTLESLFENNEFNTWVEDKEALSGITFVDKKGFAKGPQFSALFAVRNMIAMQAMESDVSLGMPESSQQQEYTAYTASASSEADDVAVDEYLWQQSTHIVTKGDGDPNGFETRVLAPDFDGKDGKSGTWVLTRLSARVAKDKVKCLTGYFKNLQDYEGGKFQDHSQVVQVQSGGDCPSSERNVELDSAKVAVGVEMKVSDNNVKSLGLAWGEPSERVNILYPDFLTNVSPENYKLDGSNTGSFAPDPSSLNASWPYVVVGVAASASDSKVTDLVVYLGKLSTPGAESGDVWNDHTVEEVESAVTGTLNTVYQGLVDTLTFQIYDDCVSTISEIKFCGNMSAKSSYSTSEMDPACSGICDGYYESCKAAEDSCEAVCSLFGGCDCGMGCGKERDSCNNGCTTTFTGSAEVNVKNVTGLDKLVFQDSTVPFLTTDESLTIGVDTTAKISDGLRSEIYWRLCQSGICFSDTTPIRTSEMKLRTRGVIEAKACSNSDAYGLYLTVEGVEILDTGAWDIDEFIDDVLKVVDDWFDWLGESLDDLFESELDDEYEEAMNGLEEEMTNALNSILKDTPVVPCP